MKVRVESSRLVMPSCDINHPPPASTLHSIPMTVFDKFTFDYHIAIIYVFRPPTPPNSHLEQGLTEVLAEYREWAGRLGEDADGSPVILLNDAGVRLVEASVDATLSMILPLKPSPALWSLHPSTDDVEELVQVQLTRFACGSLALGFTAHHRVADGHATSSFLAAWGFACRGLPVPAPLHDRSAFVVPRDPPVIGFEHRGVEFKAKKSCSTIFKDDITVHKVHYTLEFLTKLKAKASSGAGRSCTRFESLVAHLWRAVTKARGLDGHETTRLRISVNGRARMMPRVPGEYFGNLVLWAFPRAQVRELIGRPLQHAAELIHNEVARLNDDYFRSFIDFASSGAVEEEGLVSEADSEEHALWPDMDVDSWLRLPFYDLDLGGGSPFLFMPSYLPVEGQLFLVPSFVGDGSIEAYVALYNNNLASFKQLCHSLD